MLRDRPRLVGAAAVVGSVALLASTAIQAMVPVPDAYQFDPALTDPQSLRNTVAPGLTLAGIATHVALLFVRAGAESGLRLWGRRITLFGLVGAFVGYAGLFAFDAGVGPLAGIVAGLFALLALVTVGVAGLGVGLYGVALLRDDRRIDRGAGALLLLAPLLGGAITVLDVGFWLPTAVYAAGMALLGYAGWRASGTRGVDTSAATAE
ncbi:hypothetical protein [Halorarius halobius]|uniref:hypothetical protein n=1 Tax=Halorarius halobius TaxID=2962671 RepID=UPI0020CBE689|nr:hypothetical protein [Halorarius halobius]